MTNLFGLTLSQLQELCLREGWPRFTAKQMCDWLYRKRVTSTDEMTNLSLKVRARLREMACIQRSLPIDCQTSADGTKKYLFEASLPPEGGDVKGRYIETVLIPSQTEEASSLGQGGTPSARYTLCISCQRGCKMGCRFCVTGRQGFHGNLSSGEILNQIFSIPESHLLTNVVYMGMGEPMDNYDAVLASTQVLTADWGLGWSPHRITVSSVGLTPMLRRFVEESQCHIAVSLHNPYHTERLQLMPMEKAYPILSCLDMLKQYDWTGQRRISFEYTMFRGWNDDLLHAAELVRLFRGPNRTGHLMCRVNLIHFHESEGTDLQASPRATMEAFQQYLTNHGVICTIRASRGQDIMAACGLLAGTQSGPSNEVK